MGEAVVQFSTFSCGLMTQKQTVMRRQINRARGGQKAYEEEILTMRIVTLSREGLGILMPILSLPTNLRIQRNIEKFKRRKG